MSSPESVLHDYSRKYGLEQLEDVKLSISSLNILDAMFKEVLSDLLPKQSDYEHRKMLVNTMGELVKNKFGSGDDKPVVEAFGSYIMDMFTADSDLDLSIKFSGNGFTLSRDKQIDFLRKFGKVLRELRKKGGVDHIQSILSARVPIVKFVDDATGIECDMSVENHDGVLKSLIIYLISSIDDRFRLLSVLLKIWAKSHDINSSKDHTLNSLSVILLVVIHFQTRDPPILPPLSSILKGGNDPSNLKENIQRFKDFGRENKETMAELFVSFISKLLSLKNYWKYGLCASTFDGSWISSKPAQLVNKIDVEDFIIRSENCARAVTKKKFKVIYNCIQTTHKQLCSFSKGEIDISRLKSLLFGSVQDKLNPSQKKKHLDPKKKQPKKIKFLKRKQHHVLSLATTGARAASLPGSSNWDALIDRQNNSEGTVNNWGRHSAVTETLEREKSPACMEAVASTTANIAGFHSVYPSSKFNLDMAREDRLKNSANVTDSRKRPRHSSMQSGAAHYQQKHSDFHHDWPPVLPHQQRGFSLQNRPLPCLPHQIYNGLQSYPQHAIGSHRSVGVQQPHPQELDLNGVPWQPHRVQHLIHMQQSYPQQLPHPNPYVSFRPPRLGHIQESYRLQPVLSQFEPSYRLPNDLQPASQLIYPPNPASHDVNLFHHPNVQNQLYQPRKHRFHRP